MRRKKPAKRKVELSLYEFKGEFGTLRVMAMNPAQGAEIARDILSQIEIYKGDLALISTISIPDFARRR